jgi:DNA-binding transcriptional regulator YbjK
VYEAQAYITAKVATVKNNNIEYLGRKAKRSDSQATLNAILEATLLIIAAEGVSGIRHRLVAKRAGVPIGAISYYFKNKSDLIADAFMFYLEHTGEQVQKVRDEINNLLNNRSRAELEIPEVRRSIANLLTDAMANYVYEIKNQKTYLVVDHAFRHEAVRNSRLAELIAENDNRDIETFSRFFQRLGSDDPQADALMALSTYWHLCEESMISGDQRFSQERIREIIFHSYQRLICTVAAPQPAIKKSMGYTANAISIR